MKNFGQSVLFVVLRSFLVFPCNAVEDICSSVIAPSFRDGFNKVMVQQRHAFISDFKKLCRRFERDRWLNFTDKAVCFGGHYKFAAVVSPFEGFLSSIKLTHVRGHVICDDGAPKYNSRWGCSRNHPSLGKSPFDIVITAGRNNDILYPRVLLTKGKKDPLCYEKLDANPNASEIVLGDPSQPYYLYFGQELRIWLGKDLDSSRFEEANETICVIAKGWFRL
ncbi:uncharacterized protein [Montipora foliosa]|uniref:uncharacterized protein n=1 Tax=Montipora foliosa TaxID=591990 RepID=UPI0035F1C505